MRNSPAYTTASTYINNLVPLYYIFSYIYRRNPFNFNFILLNHLIKIFLTFINPILFNFVLKAALLPYSWLITTYNYPFITSYKLIFKLLAMLMSSFNLEVAAPNSVITSALGSMLLNYLVFVVIK